MTKHNIHHLLVAVGCTMAALLAFWGAEHQATWLGLATNLLWIWGE